MIVDLAFYRLLDPVEGGPIAFLEENEQNKP